MNAAGAPIDRTGLVRAVNPPHVMVEVAGGHVCALPHLAAYEPKLGDRVRVDWVVGVVAGLIDEACDE